MGTRAVITFKDVDSQFSVYQHWDGNPETVKDQVKALFASNKVWELPRFEAADAAAGYIAMYKDSGGNIYFSKGETYHGDLSYSYVVTCKNGEIRISTKQH